jgi:hypothetical protein
MMATIKRQAVLLLRRWPTLYHLAQVIYSLKEPQLWHNARWKVYATVFNKGLAHFIGNSHARTFKLQPGMIAHVISAATAHNLAKENSTTSSRKRLFDSLSRVNRRRDAVIMVFGEVDCRFHIYYQYMKNEKKLTIEELIDHTISNYGKVLTELKDKGFHLYVCSVVPASWREHSTAYPFYGSPDMRSRITRIFNNKLQILCTENGICFIDMYKPAADDNGLIKPEYKLDDIHLNEKIVPYVRAQLKKTFKNWAI